MDYLPLKVGTAYRTRSGNRVVAKEVKGFNNLTYIGNDGQTTPAYMPVNMLVHTGIGKVNIAPEQHPNDIVGLWDTPTLTLPLEAGKSYVTRTGKVVTMRKVNGAFILLTSAAIHVEPRYSDLYYIKTGLICDDGRTHENDIVADAPKPCEADAASAGHPHAHLMALYAEDAKEYADPWTRWQVLDGPRGWRTLTKHPAWATTSAYRRKPDTITVAGVELPRPLRSLPEGQTYWSFDMNSGGVVCVTNRNQQRDQLAFRDGFAYATADDAIAARKAIGSILKAAS